MDFIPHPSVLERRMDDQSVLARRAGTSTIARMHEDLATLYREQLIAVLLAPDLHMPLADRRAFPDVGA